MKVDNTLLKKFNKKGPRYTSYPPATHFTEKYDDKDFINSVERVASVSIDRKEGVKLELSKDKLKLSVNSTNSGDGNEVVAAKYDGEDKF